MSDCGVGNLVERIYGLADQVDITQGIVEWFFGHVVGNAYAYMSQMLRQR